MEFTNAMMMTDNIFIKRTTTGKYLSRKRVKVYWIFVNSQKSIYYSNERGFVVDSG
jgi:hypothetical protein